MGARWTHAQDKALRSMAGCDEGAATIAARMGRTEAAVRQRLRKIGCAPGVPVAQRVAAGLERADPVLDAWAAGETSNGIAYRLGIPRNSVCRMVHEARMRGDARAVGRGMPENFKPFYEMRGAE